MQGRRDEAELWDLEDVYAFWMNGHTEVELFVTRCAEIAAEEQVRGADARDLSGDYRARDACRDSQIPRC